jgi:hypothetical protein
MTHSCRICKDPCCEECVHQPTGICRGCLVKIGVVLFIIMIIASYTVWFGLL